MNSPLATEPPRSRAWRSWLATAAAVVVLAATVTLISACSGGKNGDDAQSPGAGKSVSLSGLRVEMHFTPG